MQTKKRHGNPSTTDPPTTHRLAALHPLAALLQPQTGLAIHRTLAALGLGADGLHPELHTFIRIIHRVARNVAIWVR